jgi:hypothetical protein
MEVTTVIVKHARQEGTANASQYEQCWPLVGEHGGAHRLRLAGADLLLSMALFGFLGQLFCSYVPDKASTPTRRELLPLPCYRILVPSTGLPLPRRSDAGDYSTDCQQPSYRHRTLALPPTFPYPHITPRRPLLFFRTVGLRD